MRYTTIPISNAISRAKMELNLEHTQEYDPYLLIIANDALMHIGSVDQISEHSAVYDIVDNKVSLPAGLVSLVAFIFVDDDGCPSGSGYVDETKILKGPIGGWLDWGYSIQANDGGQIVFDCSADLPTEKVRLFWEGRLVDKYGVSLMHEMEERGVAAYICYKFARRFPSLYDRGMIGDFKKEWENQKRFLRADAVVNSYRQNRGKIQDLWNAYVVYKPFGNS